MLFAILTELYKYWFIFGSAICNLNLLVCASLVLINRSHSLKIDIHIFVTNLYIIGTNYCCKIVFFHFFIDFYIYFLN